MINEIRSSLSVQFVRTNDEFTAIRNSFERIQTIFVIRSNELPNFDNEIRSSVERIERHSFSFERISIRISIGLIEIQYSITNFVGGGSTIKTHIAGRFWQIWWSRGGGQVRRLEDPGGLGGIGGANARHMCPAVQHLASLLSVCRWGVPSSPTFREAVARGAGLAEQ